MYCCDFSKLSKDIFGFTYDIWDFYYSFSLNDDLKFSVPSVLLLKNFSKRYIVVKCAYKLQTFAKISNPKLFFPRNTHQELSQTNLCLFVSREKGSIKVFLNGLATNNFNNKDTLLAKME